MTEAELRTHWKRIYTTLNRERFWRDRVFPVGDPQRDAKLREIDTALDSAAAIKDFAKQHATPGTHQPALIEEKVT